MAEGARADDEAQGAAASDDIDRQALFRGLTTVDDEGVGDRADRTALRKLMSAMRSSAYQ